MLHERERYLRASGGGRANEKKGPRRSLQTMKSKSSSWNGVELGSWLLLSLVYSNSVNIPSSIRIGPERLLFSRTISKVCLTGQETHLRGNVTLDLVVVKIQSPEFIHLVNFSDYSHDRAVGFINAFQESVLDERHTIFVQS